MSRARILWPKYFRNLPVARIEPGDLEVSVQKAGVLTIGVLR